MGISITPVGLGHAAAAFRKIERQQEVVANNLANVSTTGFKAERTFAHLLADGVTPSLGTVTDRRQGALTMTGAPLDVALENDGFFVVRTPDGEQLTRGGSWRLDADGQLVDVRGAAVLGEAVDAIEAGPIRVPLDTHTLRIERDGSVLADGVLQGRLRLERVPNDVTLEHAGDGRFQAPAERTVVDRAERTLRQGALEESNVSPVESMVSLIDIQRAYTNVQRAVTTIDSARGIIVGDIARPI